MVHLLSLGLLAGNAMKQVYTLEGVADRRGRILRKHLNSEVFHKSRTTRANLNLLKLGPPAHPRKRTITSADISLEETPPEAPYYNDHLAACGETPQE